jgi:type I restriction enzyme S subunit
VSPVAPLAELAEINPPLQREVRSKCFPEFLHAYFLLHPVATNYLQRSSKGAIMSGLNMGLIEAMPVIVPPLEKQSELVRRVRSVQRLRNQLEAFRRLLDALFASLQHRAFRGEL